MKPFQLIHLALSAALVLGCHQAQAQTCKAPKGRPAIEKPEKKSSVRRLLDYLPGGTRMPFVLVQPAPTVKPNA